MCNRSLHLILSLMVASAFGCGQNKTPLNGNVAPTPSGLETPPVRIQATPSAASSPPASPVSTYKSGGLGLERITWESQHGSPITGGEPFLRYENDKFAVMFSQSGKAAHIERTYGDRNAVAFGDAQADSKKLMPSDAKLIRTYTSPGSGNLVDLYRSQSLKDRFPAESFIGGKPGELVAIYRNQTGVVTSFIVAIGNNP